MKMDAGKRQSLVDTLGKVRGRILQLRERGDNITEQDTKRILILPVLSALGWQLEELDEVRSEYRRKPQDNPVDYALLVFGEPCLFVEAKALNTALHHRKCASQVLGYASVVGVGWCLVTNGDEYRLYNSHAAVDVEEKLFRTVRLSDPNQEDYCVETLGLLAKDQMGEKALEVLWKGQFIDRRVEAAVNDVFTGDDTGFARLVRKGTLGLSLGEVKESLKRARLSIDFRNISAQLRPTASEGVQSPPVEQKPKPKQRGSRVRLADLIAAGQIQPPLELGALYKDVRLTAAIDAQGKVIYGGKSYNSPSAAGGAAKGSVVGAPEGGPFPATDGWWFWQYKDPQTGDLRSIDELRKQYLKSKGQMV